MGRRLGTPSPQNASLELLIEALKEFLHLPDLGAVYTLLGAVAGNMIKGPPVWVMLIGPPSSGGSELLNMFLGLESVVEAGLIDSAAAFLSGTSEKETSKDATGGLLRQVGTNGAIVMKDFTSIISLPMSERKKVMGVFRESYDGRWTRPVGSDGGKSLQWEGKVGFFAKCTGAIDMEMEVNASLGERWAYFRMGEGHKFERSRRALSNSSEAQDWKKDLQQRIKAFYMGLGLEFKHQSDSRKFRSYESNRLIRIGDLASRCRSSVRRDQFHGDIVGVRETEMGPRITSALGQLYLGMEAIGLDEVHRWRLIAKIAFDSMPALRRELIDSIRLGKDLNGLVKRIGSGKRAVKLAIEDLEVHGVVRYSKVFNADGGFSGVKVVFTTRMEEEMAYVFADREALLEEIKQGRKRK